MGVREDAVARVVVDSAVQVHRGLGPGLLESVYEVALTHVLCSRGMTVQRQVPIDIVFDGIRLDAAFRADLVVGDLVLVELKSVDKLTAVHRKQALTYMKLGGYRLGLLLNFNTELMKHGITRLIHGRPSTSSQTRPPTHDDRTSKPPPTNDHPHPLGSFAPLREIDPSRRSR